MPVAALAAARAFVKHPTEAMGPGVRRDDERYQLRLNPALMLLFAVPCSVSPIEPLTLTPPNSCCSAPILRSHLSSVEDSVWPAMRLVPVSARLSRAD